MLSSSPSTSFSTLLTSLETSSQLPNPTSTSTTFEPVLPDTSALIAMGSILVLSVIASSVWANSVVPVSRTKLAISKNRGQVKEYLEELKEGTNTTSIITTEEGLEQEVEMNTEDFRRGFERWLFTDWLQDNKSATKKPSAVPFLKDAKWNSGDNPVLVTSGLLLVCVILASITERAGLMGIR